MDGGTPPVGSEGVTGAAGFTKLKLRASCAAGGWREGSDVDRSGGVELYDYAIMAAQFGPAESR